MTSKLIYPLYTIYVGVVLVGSIATILGLFVGNEVEPSMVTEPVQTAKATRPTAEELEASSPHIWATDLERMAEIATNLEDKALAQAALAIRLKRYKDEQCKTFDECLAGKSKPNEK